MDLSGSDKLVLNATSADCDPARPLTMQSTCVAQACGSCGADSMFRDCSGGCTICGPPPPNCPNTVLGFVIRPGTCTDPSGRPNECACTGNSQCTSGDCFVMPSLGLGRCTHSYAIDEECAGFVTCGDPQCLGSFPQCKVCS